MSNRNTELRDFVRRVCDRLATPTGRQAIRKAIGLPRQPGKAEKR